MGKGNMIRCPNCGQSSTVNAIEEYDNVYECSNVRCLDQDVFLADGTYLDTQVRALDRQSAYDDLQLTEQLARSIAKVEADKPKEQTQLARTQGNQQPQQQPQQQRQMGGYYGRGAAIYDEDGYSWLGRGGSISINRETKGEPSVAADGTIYCGESGGAITDGKCPETAPNVYMPEKLWHQWIALAKQFDTEWIAHLVGRRVPDGTVYITGMYFPPQTASGTHVDVPAEVTPKRGVIGAVHSHVGMSVFFSGTDIAHSNWDVEIVVNRRAEYAMMLRFKLGCGRYAKVTSKTLFLQEEQGGAVVDALSKAFKVGKRLHKKEMRRMRRLQAHKDVIVQRALKAPAEKPSQVYISPSNRPLLPPASTTPPSPVSTCGECKHSRHEHNSNGCWHTDNQGKLCRCTLAYGYREEAQPQQASLPLVSVEPTPAAPPAEDNAQPAQPCISEADFPYLI